MKKSTLSGQITLMTREFGVGTDFKCFDDEVEKNDGVAVIQTFLSLNINE